MKKNKTATEQRDDPNQKLRVFCEGALNLAKECGVYAAVVIAGGHPDYNGAQKFFSCGYGPDLARAGLREVDAEFARLNRRKHWMMAAERIEDK